MSSKAFKEFIRRIPKNWFDAFFVIFILIHLKIPNVWENHIIVQQSAWLIKQCYRNTTKSVAFSLDTQSQGNSVVYIQIPLHFYRLLIKVRWSHSDVSLWSAKSRFLCCPKISWGRIFQLHMALLHVSTDSTFNNLETEMKNLT